MSENEREAWDRRYREGSHSSLIPDPFLVQAFEEFIDPTFPEGGSALDLAGGVGRHSIWLAERGWRVTLSDVSEVAVTRARENSGAQAERINFKIADASDLQASEPFDLILVFFYLQRELFSRILAALSDNGMIVYKTYTHRQPRFGPGPSHPMHLLQDSELLRAFSALKVLHYHESISGRGTAELVARKI